MASTSVVSVAAAAPANNGWTQIASGAVQVVVNLYLSHPVKLAISPTASPPAAEAGEAYLLTRSSPVFDASGLIGSTDTLWARAVTTPSAVTVTVN